MSYRSQSGQILVLVLLVVLVALTIGLSIATRTLSNLKNSAELDQSNRAFSAAEAGIEKALRVLKSGGSCKLPADCSANITGVEARVTEAEAGNSTNAFGVNALDKDDVIQANLQGYSGTSLTLYWGNRGDTAAGCNNIAAAVVSVVYTSSGNYGIGKVALDPCNDASRLGNNFTRSGITSDPSFMSSGLTLQDGSKQDNYGYKFTLNLTSGGTLPLVPSGATPVMVRVRLMYAGPKPIAFDPGSNLLPFQGQQITSTATVGGKQRTVKVLKTTSALPAIFDYALFNGSTNPLTK